MYMYYMYYSCLFQTNCSCVYIYTVCICKCNLCVHVGVVYILICNYISCLVVTYFDSKLIRIISLIIHETV